MKDLRLIELRTRAERDLALSDGAFRLLCRLVSEKYNDPHFFAEESFALSWTKVQRLCDVAKDQAYERLKNLIAQGFIGKRGLKGCPAEQTFSFLLSRRENPPTRNGENPPTGSRENPPTSRREKPSPHISNPLRGKKDQKKEGIRARQGRGETRGKEGIERRLTPGENSTRVKALAAAMREAAR